MNPELLIEPLRFKSSEYLSKSTYESPYDGSCTPETELTSPSDISPDNSPGSPKPSARYQRMGEKSSQTSENPLMIEPSYTRLSRVHNFRHVLGFRTLNQRIYIGSQVHKMCDNIESIIQHDFSGVRLTVEQINRVLPTLERTQTTLFKLADRIQQHNELKHEVQYMQLNLEKCVRNSTILIQQHTVGLPLEELIDENDWHDHNQFQVLVHSLTDLLKQSDSGALLGQPITKELTTALINQARNMISQCENQSFLQSWAVSGHDLESLHAVRQELMFHENRLQESGIQHNIVTGVLLTIYTEIRSTEHRLKRCIQRLTHKYASLTDHDSIRANRDLLRELIANAKSDDRRAKEQAEEEAALISPSNNQAREFARSFRNSGYTVVPIWAQSWTSGNLKLLRRRPEALLPY